MATVTLKFSISDVPAGGAEQILADLKLAVESLLGQGKSGFPRLEKAITGQELVDLGLATEEQLNAL